MAGELKIYNGTCICLARLALTDGFGKWEPGTVLELYPLDWEFNWGDEAHFLIVKVKLAEVQIELVNMRKLKIPLDSFLSFESVEKYRENRGMKREVYEKEGLKPKFDKEVDGETFGCLTPEKYWANETPFEEILDPRIEKGLDL